MTRPKYPCKNHPQKLTARKCYYCGDPICSACQMNLAHHRFCSRFCYFKWRLKAFISGITFSKEFAVLLVLIVASNLFLLFYLDRDTKTVTEKDIGMTKETTIITPGDSGSFGLDTLRMPMKHTLQLNIEMPSNSVAALWRDGRFVTTAIQNDEPLELNTQYLHQGQNRFALWRMDQNGRSTLIDSFTIIFESARINYLRRYVTAVNTGEKLIALTFDGGSLDRGTEQILDILRQSGVRCTMFLTGRFIGRYAPLVRQMIEDNHEIANHSWSHPHLNHLEIDGSITSLPYVNRTFVYEQLLKTDSLYKILSGSPMAPYWRAPYGEVNNDILLWAAEAGYKHIGWSARCDSWDWVADSSSRFYRSSKEILDYFVDLEAEKGLQGKIILMHLGSEREKDFPYLILPDLIQTLRQRGYRFVTVSQLLTVS